MKYYYKEESWDTKRKGRRPLPTQQQAKGRDPKFRNGLIIISPLSGG
jgi:hypothetical protein